MIGSADVMDLSFLIPARNEEANISRCLSSIREFAPRSASYEILVGNHASTDATGRLAAEGGARVIDHAGGTVGGMRNLLVSLSTGRVIVFLDADVHLTPEWGHAIGRVLDELAQNPRQITGSRCSPPDINNIFIKYWFSRMPGENVAYIGTGHMILLRSIFDEIGGFEPGLKSGEDHDLCIRATARNIAVVARSDLKVVHNDYPMDFPAFFRREVWHGSGDFQSLSRFLGSKVALVATFFLMLHLFALVAGTISAAGGMAGIVLIIMLTFLVSTKKFPGLGLYDRMVNMGIFYVYMWGRALSAFSILR